MAAIAWPLVIPILKADSRFFPSSRLPLTKDEVENDYFLQEHVITRKMLGLHSNSSNRLSSPPPLM